MQKKTIFTFPKAVLNVLYILVLREYCDQYDKIEFMFIMCLKPPGAITGIALCTRAHRTAHGRSALISDDLHLLLPVRGHFELTNPTKRFYIHILYGCQWWQNSFNYVLILSQLTPPHLYSPMRMFLPPVRRYVRLWTH